MGVLVLMGAAALLFLAALGASLLGTLAYLQANKTEEGPKC